MSQRISELRNILKELEGIQRHIGQIQESIIDLMSVESSSAQGTIAVEMDAREEFGTIDQTPILSINPIEWLNSKGIVVESVKECQELDPVFDRLSNYLGRRLFHLRTFYNTLKHQLAESGGAPANKWINLEGLSPEGISDNCQFGTLLKEHHFLSEYRYLKRDSEKPHILAVANRDPRVINFFTGGWLESFVAQRILEQAKIVLKEEVQIELKSNVKVRFPNQTQAEFDMLVGVLDDVLWFECKTGDWLEMAKKYSKANEQYLQLPQDRVTLVVAGNLSESQRTSTAALHGVQVVHVSEIIDHTNNLFENIGKSKSIESHYRPQENQAESV